MEIFDSIYNFTTENIAGYMNGIDMTGKRIATITGSGDQLINCILCGAREIDTFDINLLTKYYMDLKLAAIRKLPFDKFLKIFLYNSKFSFDRKVIETFTMDKDSKDFFLRQIDGCNGDGLEFKRSSLFHLSYFNPESIIWQNMYLNRRNYNIVKRRIDKVKINYFNVSLQEFNCNGEYDYMFLSNIADYIDTMYDSDSLIKYKELMDKLLNYVKRIYCAYLYDIGSERRSSIYNINKVKEVFGKIEIETFRSVYDNGYNKKRDGVLILKQK